MLINCLSKRIQAKKLLNMCYVEKKHKKTFSCRIENFQVTRGKWFREKEQTPLKQQLDTA